MQNATRDPQFVGKKESHGISLSWGQWVLPKYNYLNLKRSHFITKQTGLHNNNKRVYITKTLMKRAVKVTATLILKMTVILIAKVTGTAKMI